MTDKSVGLVVLTDIPEIGLVAVLRERGFFNFEEMAFESWPGACQVTVHGRLKEGEDFITALLREMTEELGNDFAFDITTLLATKLMVFGKIMHIQGEKEIITYAVKVDPLLLRKIRLATDSGAIRFVTLEQSPKIADISSFDKRTGVQDRRIIAMFADEKDAVASAFAFTCYT